MKKIYTFFKAQAFYAFFASSLLCSNAAFSQCGSVIENFNNTGGSTAGFTGSFTYGSSGSNGFLVKTKVLDFALYRITTPTYQLPANANTVVFGFTLGGTERVDKVMVSIQYTSTVTGEVITVPRSPEITPQYNPQTETSDVCGTVGFSDLPGFPTGGRYRLVFDFDARTGTGAETQTITFDDFRTNGTISQIPLPVTFTGFEAQTSNNNVILTWKVAGEENVIRYEVEKSSDGRSFITIGSLAKTGQDVYTFTESKSANTVFYRVRNVDNDGQYKYSNIIRLAGSVSEIVFKAFPQPVQSRLTVQHPNIAGKALITVSTADGRVVRTTTPVAGSMESYVDMNGLQNGLYIVRFDSGNSNIQTIKVVKQ